jgi:hypothetical protein
LAAAFVLSGSRLLFSKDGGSSRIAKVDQVAPGFLLEPQLQPRRIGVQLKRRFF